MRFSQDFIEKVREANNIVDVISQYTQLKRSGGRLFGLCPFPDHNEKTPSFSVSDDKQVYYCFGCKKSGNIYTFIEAMQGLSFPETVEHLAQKAAIEIPKEERSKFQPKEGQEQKKVMWKVNDFASRFFQSQLAKLPADHPMKAYCQQRKIDDEVAKVFQVGVSLDDWEGLTHFLTRSKAPLAVAEKLGLIRKRGAGKSGHYDLFRSRLMFPIISHTGHCVGFGGRVVGDGNPKYLNSPESPVFNKGKTLYGLYETAKYIRVEDAVIVVEGYMDLIALYGAGLRNVVATLGTALTADHARLLKRYTKNIILLFDGDSAGQTAAERSLPILLAEGLLPHACVLPDKVDPDDFVQDRGAEALKAEVTRAPDLFSVVLGRALQGYQGSSSDKVSVMDKMTPILSIIADSRLRELYDQELADRLNVDIAWVKKAARGVVGQKPGERGRKSSPRPSVTQPQPQVVQPKEQRISLSKAPKAEISLVNLALVKSEYLKTINDSGIIDHFSHSGAAQVLRQAFNVYGQMPSEFDKLTALLASQVENPRDVSLHLDKLFTEMDDEGAKKFMNDCFRKVRETHMRTKAKELSGHLRGTSPADQISKLEQIMNIQKDRRSLHKDRDL